MQEQKDKSEETPAEKTPEQLAQERLERYQKEPNSFVEVSELVLASIRNPNSPLGISICIGKAKRSELDISTMEINHAVSKMMMRLDVEGEMKRAAAAELIKPASGAMLKFARGKRN
jgi:hypothetical protein